MLLGLDGELFDDGRLGVMTGYTRTSLDGGYQSDAHSDNYHLGLYGDKRFGALALRAGGTYTASYRYLTLGELRRTVGSREGQL